MRYALPALVFAAAFVLSSCSALDTVSQALGGDCQAYSETYQQQLEAGGALAQSIPATPEGFAMGVVLNQNAVNDLFRRLGDVALPTLTQAVPVPLLGDIALSITPSLPTLGIGGDSRCPDCFNAGIPFQIGIGLGGREPSVVGGAMAVQMPLQMIPMDADRTALTAQFQTLTVTDLDIEFQRANLSLASTATGLIENAAEALLTGFLRSRFEDARIATFDAWALGQGAVKLAGRGPFVHPANQTIVIAMQSNLNLGAPVSMDIQTAMPEGADVGFVFDPSLLLAMTQRMHYEGVIPQGYSETGQVAPTNPSTGVTFQTMQAQDDGLLRTQATMYRTNNLCGTANLSAALGLVVEPGVFAFSVQDVAITDGQGVGALFSQDTWLTGGLVDAMLDTLDFTINYDQMFGGETESATEMAPVRAQIDGRGVAVYLNL